MKDNFIRIEPFMTKNLGLRGFDLLVFAIIYGFTKTNGCYIGGHKYFVKEFGFDRVTVYRSIERLKKANLIIVEKVGIGLEICCNMQQVDVSRCNIKGCNMQQDSVATRNINRCKTQHKNTNKTNKTASISYARGENPRPRAEPERLDVKGSMIDISDYSLPFEF